MTCRAFKDHYCWIEVAEPCMWAIDTIPKLWCMNCVGVLPLPAKLESFVDWLWTMDLLLTIPIPDNVCWGGWSQYHFHIIHKNTGKDSRTISWIWSGSQLTVMNGQSHIMWSGSVTGTWMKSKWWESWECWLAEHICMSGLNQRTTQNCQWNVACGYEKKAAWW